MGGSCSSIVKMSIDFIFISLESALSRAMLLPRLHPAAFFWGNMHCPSEPVRSEEPWVWGLSQLCPSMGFSSLEYFSHDLSFFSFIPIICHFVSQALCKVLESKEE